ncbi:hypothetical protein TGPRC2_280375A, partial [Toxoplasma gondii TgCatPRC2]
MAAIATAQPKSQACDSTKYLAGRSEARLCEGHMCHGHLLIKRRKTRQAERVTASVSNYKQLI